MEQFYSKNRQVLDYKTACDQVEKYLEEELDRVLKLRKARSKYGLDRKDQEDFQEPSYTPNTITSGFNTSAPPRKEYLSREDSIKEAAKLIRYVED